jgi:hypothetical protein
MNRLISKKSIVTIMGIATWLSVSLFVAEIQSQIEVNNISGVSYTHV